MKRIFVLLLCLLLLLAGCGPTNDTADDSTQEETSAQTEAEIESIMAVSEGKPLLKICYSEYENLAHAKSLQSLLKKKTGVTFEIVTNANKLDGLKGIFIGFVKGRDEIHDIFKNNISYNGYGTVFNDGNVYICGYSETSVNKAVSVFGSSLKNSFISKNAEGGVAVVFDKSMAILTNPEYEITSPKLLGADLADYSVAIGAKQDKYLKELINDIIVKNIGEQTGAYVEVVSSASNAHDRAITVKMDATMELLEYSIKSNGEKIEIEVGGLIAAYSAFEDIKGMLNKDTASGIDLTANAADTFLAGTGMSADASIRVMSANVLATWDEEVAPCNAALRSNILGEYILALSPDSVGLQEYAPKHQQYLGGRLLGKYSAINFEGYGVNWDATLYRVDKYTPVESNMIPLVVDGGQDYYFSWVALKDNTTEEIYIHGNLHLDYRGDSYRVSQAALVNEELVKVRAKYPDAVVAVTGDYNCMLGNAAITDIMQGLNMNDASVAAPDGKADNRHKTYGEACEFSEIYTGKNDAIDHILITEDTASVKLHKIIHDTLICHSSDHYPVIADIAKRQP